MVFKLVQIDSENPLKIKLEVGTHIFGRGKFLNINDKRISRQHGQFEVTDDSLIITALHQNPCFYQKRGSMNAEILRQSSSVNLDSGDKLGLLPTSHWYEVLQCKLKDDEENKKTEKESQLNASQEVTVDSNEETDYEVESVLDSNTNANVICENANVESQSTEVLSPNSLDRVQSSNVGEFDNKNCDSHNTEATEVPGMDSSPTRDFDTDMTHAKEHVSSLPLLRNEEVEEKSDEDKPCSVDQISAVQKRAHSTGADENNDEAKKIKTESEDKPDVKLDPDGQQAGSSSADNKVGVDAPQAVAVPLRERCMYGASCYRRNPAHRAQFSHPHDVDWGTGAKAPCPWGAACCKRDPRHWRDHDHPPGKEQPPPQPGKKKKRDRSDTPPNDLIVKGKRVRRTVMRASWSVSDESDSDPYHTDEESDDWEPSSEYTESQN